MESTISPVLKSFLAGSVSGTCSTLLFQPLDLVKTRIQVPLNTRGPVGMLSVANSVIRQDTIIGLWKGLVPSMSRCVPGIGIYFSSIHYLRSVFESDQKRALESILIGAAARTISVVTVIPFTVLKTRYESGNYNYNNILRALAQVYNLEGARGLFTGIAPTLVRDVPFSGLYLMFYTKLKDAVDGRISDQKAMSAVYFCCGLTAGTMASLITQPADVVKTHMQLFPKDHRKILHTIAYIYKQQGLNGFFRGIVPRTLRRTMMAAMAWTVYEELTRKLRLK